MNSAEPPLPPRLHTARCRDQQPAADCDSTCITEGGDKTALVAFDIDGVLAPEVDPGDDPPPGFIGYPYSGPNSIDQHIDTTVYLHPEHGPWMTELVDHGAELVWASTWRAVASPFIGPRLGLPAAIPFIDVGPYAGTRFGHSLKQHAVADAVGERPLAWLDDHFGGKDEMWAEERTAAGIPTLLVQTDSTAGLRREHIDMVIIWLEAQKLSADSELAPWRPVQLPDHEEAQELLDADAGPDHEREILHHFITDQIYGGVIDGLKLVLKLVQAAGRYAAYIRYHDPAADEQRCLGQAIEKIPHHIDALLADRRVNDEATRRNAVRLAAWAIAHTVGRA